MAHPWNDAGTFPTEVGKYEVGYPDEAGRGDDVALYGNPAWFDGDKWFHTFEGEPLFAAGPLLEQSRPWRKIGD